MNGIERFAAQLINANEELLDITKYDRGLRAPAIRVRMMKRLFAEQHATLAQQLHYVAIGIEDVFASQIR